MNRFARRDVMKMVGLGAAVPVMGAAQAMAPAKSLYAPIVEPSFPPLSLDVQTFGAVGDGATLCTSALQDALDRCSALGGGEVLIPAGRFKTGTIFIRSRTRLRLADGAEIVGSGNLADYPLSQVRWEGKWIKGHCSLIMAVDAEDIAIAGPGKITGNDAVGGVPRGENRLRYPALIEPIGCRRVLFDGFSTSYDRMWNIHPTNCDDVIARNLTIRATEKGRDGIDVDSCRRVRIVHCDISVGDDCIALKSGRGAEGFTLARPTEDVLISDCVFSDWNWACIGIGSEMSGGVRHVRIENCRFRHAKTHAIYIKGQIGRGGYVEDIDVSNIDVAETGLGFLRFNFLTSGKQDEDPVPGLIGMPDVKNFRFRGVRVHHVPQLVEGWELSPQKPLVGLVLDDISGECAKGIRLANARNVVVRNIRLAGLTEPLLKLSNVQGAGLAGAVAEDFPAPPPPAKASKPYKLR